MQKIREIYQDNLLYIFSKDKLQNTDKEFLVVIKKDTEIQPLDNCLTLYYEDDFEAYVKTKLPPKIRKVRKLLSMDQCYEIIERIPYGTCAFMDEYYPYIFPMNTIFYNNRIFIHTGLTGHKLTGINKPIALNVVDDLGVNRGIGTHNHQSVNIFGTLRLIEDKAFKKEILFKLIKDLSPTYPFHDRMLDMTNVLEIEVDYVIGKRHFH